jgi:hypothetical protein
MRDFLGEEEEEGHIVQAEKAINFVVLNYKWNVVWYAAAAEKEKTTLRFITWETTLEKCHGSNLEMRRENVRFLPTRRGSFLAFAANAGIIWRLSRSVLSYGISWICGGEDLFR